MVEDRANEVEREAEELILNLKSRTRAEREFVQKLALGIQKEAEAGGVISGMLSW